MARRMRTSRITSIGLLSLVAACTNQRASTLDDSALPVIGVDDVAPSASAVADTTPPRPVASLDLANGNVLEFYELERGALVSEVGDASTTPLFDAKRMDARDLVTVWQRLGGRTPVPPALTAMQQRLTTPNASHARTETKNVSSESVARAESGSQPRVAAAGSCGNGCCNSVWLTNNICNFGATDASWFLLDYGWSAIGYDDIWHYGGAACAAVGTSTFSVTVAGKSGGTWSVPQGTYRAMGWLAAYDVFFCLGLCGEDMRSFVNSPVATHDHTYCGAVLFD